MLSPNPIETLQRRLLELGCPAQAARKIVREARDHFEDLQKAALAQGLTEAAAKAQAAELLGDPNALAEKHVEVLRKSSWFGRHPMLGFGCTPVLAVVLSKLAFASIEILLYKLYSKGETIVLTNNPNVFFHSQAFLISQREPLVAARVLAEVIMVVLAFAFCRLVVRHALSFRWAVASCALLTLFYFFFQFNFIMGRGEPFALIGYSIAFSFQPTLWRLFCGIAAWLIVSWSYNRQRPKEEISSVV